MARNMTSAKDFTAIDLFAGAGGMSLGFEQAGFQTVAANEFDDSAGETYVNSHPNTVFLDEPIQDVSTRKFRSRAGPKKRELDVLLGGPPCQAFSVYNHQRGMHDERSGLFREYLRVVEGFLPSVVVMENVTGITSVAKGRAVNEFYSSLKKLGYFVEHRVLKGEDYGIPQERRRIFFVGIRNHDHIPWPKPTHGKDRKNGFVTVSDAISELPPLLIKEGSEDCAYPIGASTPYQKKMRRNSKRLFNHEAPNLSNVNQERLKHIPQGGSWRDIPFDLLPAGMQRAKRSDHTKRYGRLRPEGLASTVLTKCDIHWGAFIHYDLKQQRTLTVREAARIQSIPDKVRFYGPRIEQFRQVGNAVPPLLASAVAKMVLKFMRKR
jgi:DNA (cytosine-5)-methyltransferase 1